LTIIHNIILLKENKETDFANKIDQALGKRSVTLKRLEDEKNNLQESLHEAKLAEAALLTEIEALRKREILLNNELEEYERKNYKHRFMTSEKDNKKLKEKIKGLGRIPCRTTRNQG